MSCAVVTGGSRGIGSAIALALADKGYDIVLNYYGDDANQTKAAIEQRGVSCTTMEGDVSNEEDVTQLMNTAKENYGGIDVLVNNAGITKDGLFLRMSEEDFIKVVDTNLKGTFLCSKAAAGIMMKAKKGSIINIASVVGVVGNAGQVNYAASKAGIIGMTKSMAKELAGRSIRVNAIAPGFIQTAMTEQLPEKVQEAAKESIPLKRFGTPEDVAQMAGFLTEASYVTGQILHVDGGMVM